VASGEIILTMLIVHKNSLVHKRLRREMIFTFHWYSRLTRTQVLHW